MFKKSLSFLLILTFVLGMTGIVQAKQLNVLDTGIEPVLVIEDIKVDDTVPIDKEFLVTFVVRNVGAGTAYYPEFEFTEPGSNSDDKLPRFTIVGGNGNRFKTNVKEVKSQEVATFVVKMKAKKTVVERAEGYKLNVNLRALTASNVKHKDETGKSFDNVAVTSNASLTVIPKYAITDPSFVIKNITFEPQTPNLDKPFKVNFFIENISDADAENVKFSIDSTYKSGEGENATENFKVTDMSYARQLFNVKAHQTRKVTYTLEAEQPRDGNDLKIRIDYEDDSEQKKHEEVINLPLSRDDIGSSGKVPQVIISKYTLSDRQILAGNTVVLKLDVQNTNVREIKNAKVSIVDVQLEDDKKGDTVFSPVDSSNTFYIDRIPGKTTIEKEIALYVDPNAQAKTYTVPIEIKYEYGNGKESTVNERVTIPVTQECKFKVLSLDVAKEGSVGMPIPIASEFVNVGKVDVTNFMVNLEGDFQKENASYYVGNLEQGASEFFQATVIPEKEGELQGKVVYTYTDNNNQEVKEERPFTINIAAAPEMPENMGPDGEMGMPGDMGSEGGEGFVAKLKNNWGKILLGLVILIQFIVIRKTKRKLKQDGETFDV